MQKMNANTNPRYGKSEGDGIIIKKPNNQVNPYKNIVPNILTNIFNLFPKFCLRQSPQIVNRNIKQFTKYDKAIGINTENNSFMEFNQHLKQIIDCLIKASSI